MSIEILRERKYVFEVPQCSAPDRNDSLNSGKMMKCSYFINYLLLIYIFLSLVGQIKKLKGLHCSASFTFVAKLVDIRIKLFIFFTDRCLNFY